MQQWLGWRSKLINPDARGLAGDPVTCGQRQLTAYTGYMLSIAAGGAPRRSWTPCGKRSGCCSSWAGAASCWIPALQVWLGTTKNKQEVHTSEAGTLALLRLSAKVRIWDAGRKTRQMTSLRVRVYNRQGHLAQQAIRQVHTGTWSHGQQQACMRATSGAWLATMGVGHGASAHAGRSSCLQPLRSGWDCWACARCLKGLVPPALRCTALGVCVVPAGPAVLGFRFRSCACFLQGLPGMDGRLRATKGTGAHGWRSLRRHPGIMPCHSELLHTRSACRVHSSH